MKSDVQLKKSIMRRVYGVYAVRKLTSPTARMAAFFIICLAVASSVSMPNVIANTIHASNMLAYVLSALAGTKVYIQLGVLAAGLIALWSATDLVREPEGQLV